MKPAAGIPAGQTAGIVWTDSAMHATYSQARIDVISPSRFRAFFDVTRPMSAKEPIMIGLVRATVICAALALGLTAAGAADKAFKRDELADSAVKLEAQIKSEAGPVAKSSATLRSDADAAFRRSDFRVGLQILGQIAATTPEDSANWLKLAKTIFQIRSASSC